MTKSSAYLDGIQAAQQLNQKAAQLAADAQAKSQAKAQAQALPGAYLKRIQAGQQDQARAPYQHAASVCPRCFTPEQWVLWRTPHHSVRVPAKHCCEDCTPEY